MPHFRKKPVVIEAVQWTGNNLAAVLAFTGKHPKWGDWFASFADYEAHVRRDRFAFKILTLEGTMEALPGDWIIRGVKGEHYPCKPDIFAATYEPAQPQPIGANPLDNSETAIERDIQAKGLTAPRLTPALIDATIIAETFHVFPGTTLTVCVLTLQNGFTVTGESAAASPENFDEVIGRRIARDNARAKIWALEGYLLKTRLHETVSSGPGLGPIQFTAPAGSLFDELQLAVMELCDVVAVVATDLPLGEDVAQRIGLAVANGRRLVGGG